MAAHRLALAVRGLGVVSRRPRGARGGALMVFINHRASATKTLRHERPHLQALCVLQLHSSAPDNTGSEPTA